MYGTKTKASADVCWRKSQNLGLYRLYLIIVVKNENE